MKEDYERKNIRANKGENARKTIHDCGEYFDPDAIPPEKLIPYTDSLIFSLVMRDEEICRGVLQAILEYTGVLSNVTGQNAWEV